uniref:Uncharacterized protein n=1 Tax=Avena sativa TaxID=4498 RepID=A0ACD5Y228_AVESA
MTMLTSDQANMVVVVLVLISTVFSSFPTAVVADANFIAQVCQKAQMDGSQCVEVLSTDPRSFNATSYEDLASISLDIATSTCRDVAKGIHDEASKHDYRSAVGEILGKCGEYYDQAKYSLKDARESFDKRTYIKAMEEAVDAEDYADECEQAFSNANLTSIVAAQDERMRQRCVVAVDLLGLLVK